MNERNIRPICIAIVLVVLLSGAFILRIVILKERALLLGIKPRLFMYSSYLLKILTLLIIGFGVASSYDKTIELFCLERAINLLLGACYLAFAWLVPGTAYSASTITSLLMVFVTIWFILSIALDSWIYSLLFTIPFLLYFVLFFSPITDIKGAESYFSAFKWFGIRTCLVLLSYIAYRYVIKNQEIKPEIALILLGWFAIFLHGQFSVVDLGPFNLRRFFSLAYLRAFIYTFWLTILIRRWWLRPTNGVMV